MDAAAVSVLAVVLMSDIQRNLKGKYINICNHKMLLNIHFLRKYI